MAFGLLVPLINIYTLSMKEASAINISSPSLLGRKALVDHLVEPLVKLPVLVVIVLELLGPDGGLEVFELVEEVVEDELAQLLGDEHDQTFRDEGNVVVHDRCSRELHAVLAEALELDHAVLQVKQLTVLHVVLRVDIEPIEVILLLVHSFGKYVNRVQLL